MSDLQLPCALGASAWQLMAPWGAFGEVLPTPFPPYRETCCLAAFYPHSETLQSMLLQSVTECLVSLQHICKSCRSTLISGDGAQSASSVDPAVVRGCAGCAGGRKWESSIFLFFREKKVRLSLFRFVALQWKITVLPQFGYWACAFKFSETTI